jgi:hypothetical protein
MNQLGMTTAPEISLNKVTPTGYNRKEIAAEWEAETGDLLEWPTEPKTKIPIPWL